MHQRSNRLKIVVVLLVVIVMEIIYLRRRSLFPIEEIPIILPSGSGKVSKLQDRPLLLSQIHSLLSHMENFNSSVDCKGVTIGDETASAKAELWSCNGSTLEQWKAMIAKSKNKCSAIKNLFAFADKPYSSEEEDFPLAYGMLVYKDAMQIYLMLSALYQPQNQFCIAVDESAEAEFKDHMDLLNECYPNIHVKYVKKVTWCGFSVIQGVYGCVKTLSSLKSDWKYYQYLSGVDLPLKTNLEMVRIFKQLNGSFNAEVTTYQKDRLRNKDEKPPVELWKSSLSATFSRASADFMVQNEKVHEVYAFLKDTECADESFWTTVAGNPKEIPMPGGFDAEQWFAKITKERAALRKKNATRLQADKYYISRMQTWIYGGAKCHGEFISSSCAYGVRDIPMLLATPELVAHKFYMNIQPASYFCLYATIRQRALYGDDRDFTAEEYAKLAGPQLLAGKSVKDVQFMDFL